MASVKFDPFDYMAKRALKTGTPVNMGGVKAKLDGLPADYTPSALADLAAAQTADVKATAPKRAVSEDFTVRPWVIVSPDTFAETILRFSGVEAPADDGGEVPPSISARGQSVGANGQPATA